MDPHSQPGEVDRHPGEVDPEPWEMLEEPVEMRVVTPDGHHDNYVQTAPTAAEPTSFVYFASTPVL